jgi:hypothetical protein
VVSDIFNQSFAVSGLPEASIVIDLVMLHNKRFLDILISFYRT